MVGRDRVDPRALGTGALLVVCLATSWAAADRIQAAPQGTPSAAAATSTPALAEQRALFAKYCVTCHSQALKARGTVPVAFDTLDISNVAGDAETWERIVLKMRAGLMPPAGAPRPDKAAHDRFVTRSRGRARSGGRREAQSRPHQAFHRLNRTEYHNAVRDLLDLDVDVSSLLPADDASYGFDNIAGVLKLSPTLMERYLTAAQKISRLAVGTPPPTPAIDYYRVADDLSQDIHLPGHALRHAWRHRHQLRVPDGRGVRDPPAG